MNNRTFLLGILAVFGLPWLALLGVPYGKFKNLQPVPLDDTGTEVYPPPMPGQVKAGQAVYLKEGCHQCHTQVVRPTYAGPDRWRKGWAGEADLARETRPEDYLGLDYAPLGVQRVGPDLANIGVRQTDAAWHYRHLYNPRSVHPWSVMPSFHHLFTLRRIEGQGSADAVNVPGIPDGFEIVPKAETRHLVAYLLTLRKDSPVPAPQTAAATTAQ